jgi:hypothetical protein
VRRELATVNLWQANCIVIAVAIENLPLIDDRDEAARPSSDILPSPPRVFQADHWRSQDLMRNLYPKLLLFVVCLLGPAMLFAQDSSVVVGTVTDASGAVVPGTVVVLTNPSTGVSFKQTTDKQGAYRFPTVPAHEGYTITFTHSGFATQKVANFPVAVATPRTQDAKLIAGNTDTVDVSLGSSITLNTTDASIGTNVDVEQLNELPIQDRTSGVTTLFSLQAGVDFTSGAVTGARIDQTEVTLDGIDVNDIASGQTFAIISTAPVDSVQEFGGTVAGLVPAVGTGSGGQFQLVTKSGTNKFHGNVNEYHRDTTTVANSWFNNLDGVRRPPLIRNQFGGNIGGPILHDKLFFFFELNDSRIIQSSTGESIVPLPNLLQSTLGANTLNYINSNAGCGASSRLNTTPNCISSLTAAQVAALDPAGIGFDPSVMTFLNARYSPHAVNDPAAGDGVNTGGHRFTYPTPDIDTTYIAKVDYNLTPKQHIFARATINRRNATSSLPVFETDPASHPLIDRSYGYVISHIWTIGNNKVNQFYYGDNISKLSFPNSYNPTGANQYSFTGLSGPYTGTDGQKRRVPIPEIRDDFNWQIGSHSITFGGLFKFIKTNSNLINNFNFVGVGATGSALGSGLDSAVRPADINGASAATVAYDNLFASTLGAIGDISTNYNYNKAGAPLAAGGGGPRAYRYFETELYAGDTWKATPKLSISYGVRYQLYSVPYEAHGQESIEFTNSTDHNHTTIDNIVNARIAQQNAGNTSNTGLPIYSVALGGKANGAQPLYNPSYKDFAPRLGFAYHAAPNTVVSGSAGIIYDRTVINAINFLQDQISYLFSNTQTNQFGAATTDASLATNPRINGTIAGTTPAFASNLIPAPAALTVPYTPYLDDAAGDLNGTPNTLYGLASGETNFIISPNLKDPYSIAFNVGIEQKFNDHLLFKVSYAGRLGRRLLADADAGQVIDVPDYTGKSTQSMAQAFAGLTTQTRACQAAGKSTTSAAACPLTPQPWFEDVLGPFTLRGSKTNLVNAMVTSLAPRGDISDMLQSMANYTVNSVYTNFLPTNIGIPSQFGSNAFLTNKGNSNYHGLLVTLEKSTSYGLKFDFNYTWSHSIDNTSLSANANSLFSNSGFICDITKPRACRGTSDFDVTQIITSDFVYALPFGRKRQFMNHAPIWAEELAGGWSVSGLPTWRTGLAVTPYSDAYLASFDNLDPAIYIGGNKGDLKMKVNTDHTGKIVYGFAGGQAGANKALADFRGPIGLEYGNRNFLRGPGYTNLDAGLAKRFPIIPSKDLNLIFRADFFNVLNHPSFGTPGVNIVGNQSIFGQIGGTASTARVGQFSARIEF